MPRRFRDETEVAASRRRRQDNEAEQRAAEAEQQPPEEGNEEGCIRLNDFLGNSSFKTDIMSEFALQADALRAAARQRREAVQLRNVVADKEMQEAVSVEDTLGKRQPGDEYQGDINMRTLRTLLSIVDQRGFERVRRTRKMSPAFFSFLRVRFTESAPNEVSLRL